MAIRFRTARVGAIPASMAEARRWRCSWAYQRFRRELLRSEPLCRECARQGRTRQADELDHVRPLRHANLHLFWEMSNLQPLCAACHRAKSDSENRCRTSARHRQAIEAITARALATSGS